MIQAQRKKVVRLVAPVAVDDATATSQECDTLGFRYAVITAHIGNIDIALSALKITECDTSGGTFADITGLRFGTDENVAGSTSGLPSSTDDNKFWEFDIDLRGRKRFLKVVATVGNGSVGAVLTVIAQLFRPDDAPDSASDRGCEEILRVP